MAIKYPNWLKLGLSRAEIIILLVILVVTLGLRLYKIDQYMTFLGDEGRDALVITQILVNYDLPLLGPPTSVGNMYLGPLYYYMMAVAMALSGLNPIGAAVMVAFIGTATVGLLYYLARQWFGWIPAIIAASLYALSPVTIIYSRSSWNPNPAPFFVLLAILGLYNAKQYRNGRWFILTGIALAFSVQMHYLALILVPIYLTITMVAMWWQRSVLAKWRYLKSGLVLAVLAFALLMSPLLIFDLRYDWMNTRAISTFFLGDRETTVNLNIFNTLGRIWPIYQTNLIEHHLTPGYIWLAQIFSGLLLLPLLYGGIRLYRKFTPYSWPMMALTIWLVASVMGLALYKQTIYDHYVGFLNPVLYLVLAALIWLTTQLPRPLWQRLSQIGLAILLLIVFGVNLQALPVLKAPNNQLASTQKVAQAVIELSGGQPFNFALIAEHNYDAAYQFYLDQYGYSPQKLPDVKTDQLIVVCEDKVCQPIGHPKYEIAAFGWSLIDTEQTIEHVKLFKLIPNPAEISND